MRHDRRRAARILGLESTIEEMRNDAKNRLFDEKRAWENQHIDLRHFQDLERFLADQIEEYRRSAIEEIDREWKQAEEQRAPRRLVHR
jgi:Rps23 Pro-64 3,4-dihydroxylase Tpa1-like proline 4-hydroxylase